MAYGKSVAAVFGEDLGMKMLLEVCVDSVESAVAAEQGGADRLELCGNLVIGGTTPEISLYRAIREAVSIPIRVMIRPRYGDFCYTEHEFGIMRDGIRTFRELGADGFVFGILLPNGNLDNERMQILIEESGNAPCTLHRCFDLSCNPFDAMEGAIRLGFDTILTSGQEASCEKGINLLAELNRRADNRIRIMAGSGVNASVVPKIYEETHITAYHMSGQRLVDSRMEFRRESVPMGVPGFDEYKIIRTDEENIVKARAVLDSL